MKLFHVELGGDFFNVLVESGSTNALTQKLEGKDEVRRLWPLLSPHLAFSNVCVDY